jgi:hypothetical protein
MHPIVAAFGLGTTELLLIVTIFGIFAAISAIPAILAFVVLSRIPPEHRKQEPGLAFLLLIPLFSMVWAFFVHPRVAASLQSYYATKGDASVGDCGASLALWLCICSIVAIVPLVSFVAGPAALVLLIIFYVKAFDLSSRIGK